MGIEWQGEGAEKGMFLNVITEKGLKLLNGYLEKKKSLFISLINVKISCYIWLMVADIETG